MDLRAACKFTVRQKELTTSLYNPSSKQGLLTRFAERKCAYKITERNLPSVWRITAVGRRLLKVLAKNVGGRRAFGVQVGIGKNQVKPILDDPNHTISNGTLGRLCDFSEEFQAGVHYVNLNAGDGVDLRLARDRNPGRTLSMNDQQGIETLYGALYRNPQFSSLRRALDSPADFYRWFDPWVGGSEDLPSEQVFVYRVFRNKVISFLFGERRIRTSENPIEIFAIWYLVGVSNASYKGSPVGLEASDAQALPIGERETTVGLTVRLLEELREQRSVSYLAFEVEAEELRQPDSYGRLLFRIYARAEEDTRKHFENDVLLKDARFYVLGFPYFVPREQKDASGESVFHLVEHRLVCCPLFPDLRKPFESRQVPPAIVRNILTSLQSMYWDYFDSDSPKRAAIQEASQHALRRFDEDFLRPRRSVPSSTLRDLISAGFLIADRKDLSVD